MKTSKMKQVVALVGFLPAIALAQQYETSQNVTFALTATETAPSLPARDSEGVLLRGEPLTFGQDFTVSRGAITTRTREESSKMLVMRVGNRQILEALLEERVISNITGYSIAHYALEGDNDLYQAAFFLVKPGTAPIDISTYLKFGADGADAETYSYRKVITENETTESSTERITETSSGKSGVSLIFKTAEGDANFVGVASYTGAYRYIRQGTETIGLYVPGATTINGCVGSSDLGEDDEQLIEGRISMAPGTVLPSLVK